MKKPYALHESQYRRLAQEGLRSWEDGQSKAQVVDGIDRPTLDALRFFFSKPWMPTAGSVLEFGCGTGPILRWIAARGFSGHGVDISATAIEMARSQSEGHPVVFEVADVCGLDFAAGRFDIVVDGHCAHCITDAADRARFFANIRRSLEPNGVFILATMCAPTCMSPEDDSSRQILKDDKLYVPLDNAGDYSGSTTINGKAYVPIRHVGHWQTVLAEAAAAGLDSRVILVEAPSADSPFSTLTAALAHRDGQHGRAGA